jgi:hypothetical protein
MRFSVVCSGWLARIKVYKGQSLRVHGVGYVDDTRLVMPKKVHVFNKSPSKQAEVEPMYVVTISKTSHCLNWFHHYFHYCRFWAP